MSLRCAAAVGARYSLVPRGGRRVLATLGRMKQDGDLPRTWSSRRRCSCLREPPTARALEELARRRSSRDRSFCRRARRAAGRVLGAARRLRRGARRPGRLRPLLRGAGDDSRSPPRVREARASQRAEHLPGRAAPHDVAVKLGASVSAAPSSSAIARERAPELGEGRGDDSPPDLGIPVAVRTASRRSTRAALADVLDDAWASTTPTLPPAISPLAPGPAASHPPPSPSRAAHVETTDLRRCDPQGSADARRRPAGLVAVTRATRTSRASGRASVTH